MSVGVVIVNYNCARLSFDAASSVLADDPSAKIIIVDNASTDDSRAYFQSVLSEGSDHTPASPDLDAAPWLRTFAPNFVSVADVQTVHVEADDQNSMPIDETASLVILYANENNGFAAGSNIGLNFLRARFSCDVYLLLNPDALVGAGAIAAFRERLADKSIGLCGGSIIRFENPTIFQSCGGAQLHPLTLLGKNISGEMSTRDLPGVSAVEDKLDYPLGAAIALRADYLETVGLLDERFFLYYEEIDWAFRGKGKYRCGWASAAAVYHRHGASAGSRIRARVRSPIADYHMIRSRLLFALRWRPLLVPLLFLFSLLQSLRRGLRGHGAQARSVLRATADFARRPAVIVKPEIPATK